MLDAKKCSNLADGAVCCEPVSTKYSLIYRENTGKFTDSGLIPTSYLSKTAAAIDPFSLNSLR
jgi:hypothetical protein